MTTDELLSAFIDGELPPEEMEAVRRSVEADASLARRIEALKSADRLVAGAYRGIDDEPMPQSVLDLLTPRGEAVGDGGSNVVSFPPRRRAGAPLPWAAALAASLALAVGLGLGLQLSTGPATSARDNLLLAGVIEKGDPLYSALETAPSAQTVSVGAKGGASLTPVLTFRSEAGDYCREFITEAGGRSNRALACRQDDQWTVEFAVAATPRPADGASYSTASSDLNAAFDSFVDDLIVDEPLAPEEEKAVIEAGWKAGR